MKEESDTVREEGRGRREEGKKGKGGGNGGPEKFAKCGDKKKGERKSKQNISEAEHQQDIPGHEK